MFDPISLAIYVGLTLVSQGLAARRARRGKKDIEFPTIEPNRKKPYGAGTFELAPHVAWWGDFKRSSVNLDIPSGFMALGGVFGLVGVGILGLAIWLIQKLPFGYRYYIGMALALCYGPDVRIRRIKVGDHVVWTGTVSGGSLTVNAPGEFGAEGGLFAVCDFVPGSMSQLRNPYIETQVPFYPALRGTAVLYWRGPSSAADAPTGDASALLNEVRYTGYIGRSTVVKPFLITLDRFPNYLGTDFSVVNTYHANFAEVIFELLTDPTVGLGIPTSFIDLEGFEEKAETLFDEDLGCSFKWEEPTEIGDMILQLLETIDGSLYSRLDDGKITLHLNRADYDPDALPLIDETHTGIELEIEKSDPNNSVGEVRLDFQDVTNNFLGGTALYQSLSNRTRHGNAIVSTPLDRLGVGDSPTANKIVTRDARALTVPPDRGTLTANRDQYDFHVGSAFRLTWSAYELVEAVFRVLDIDYGTLEDGRITYEIAEDRSAFGEAQLGDNVTTLWDDPIVINPTNGQTRQVISHTTTAPPASPEIGDRYWVPAGGTGDWAGQIGFASWDGTQWIFEEIENSIFNPFISNEPGSEGLYFWDGTTLRQAITTAYNTVQDEGIVLTRRETLNFIGAGVKAFDDSTNSRTNITITEPLAGRALGIALEARALAATLATATPTDQTARNAAQAANELAARALGIALEVRTIAAALVTATPTDQTARNAAQAANDVAAAALGIAQQARARTTSAAAVDVLKVQVFS